MNIVFMGTPDFAKNCLKALLNTEHNIIAVFTQPDKPVGRKQILTPSDVKICAKENDIPVFQPKSMKTEESYELLKKLNPDICVVVAYGKLLPKNILDIPKFGCINVHASLLPYYRGASPIQWSIVCGEKETGVSTMLLDEGMDTGDILLSEKIEIGENEKVEMLWDRLSALGAELLVKTLQGLSNNSIKPIKQDNSIATYAPIIKKTDGLIDWNKSAKEINCLIRGLHCWPVAYSYLDDKILKIFDAEIIDYKCENAGKILSKEKELLVACGSKALKINELQLEGSKRMLTADFLRGKTINSDYMRGK